MDIALQTDIYCVRLTYIARISAIWRGEGLISRVDELYDALEKCILRVRFIYDAYGKCILRVKFVYNAFKDPILRASLVYRVKNINLL